MSDILASVSVVLGAEISGFRAAMADARKELRGLVQFSEGLKDIGKSLTTYVSAPLALLGAGALKVGGDFQSAFNRVQADTQATGASLTALRDKAQKIALDPNLKFSSVEAAQAIDSLAKNGLNVTQILGGAADASTALATATGAQLATAADITTDVMNNFGKSAEQAAGLVSNITGTTIASKFAIDDYRLALGQAGAVAGQLGVSFEDFNTALGVTSSGFSSGSDAGTSFKTFLQRLVPQSKEAETAIKQLGLNFFDTQGKMLPLRDVAGQLQKAFKGLSDEQKNALGTKIFGTDSIRTALLLAKDGVAGFDQMAASIAKVNAASQGEILNKGFVGAFEAFKSSMEGLAQAIADSGILDFATRLAQIGASLASRLAQASPELLQFGVALGGIALATGPVLVAVGTLGAALPALTAGFKVLGLESVAALGPILPAAAAVAAAAFVIYENWDSITAYFSSGEGSRLFSDLADAATSAASAIGEAFSGLRASVGSSVGDMLAALGPVLGSVLKQLAVDLTGALNVLAGSLKAVSSFFKGFSTGDFTQALDGAKQAFFGLIDPIAALLGFTPKLQEANPILVLSKSATEFNAAFPQFQANLNALNAVRLGPLAEQAAGVEAGLKRIAQQTGLLADLEARLKTAKDAKPNLTTEDDITASNQLIASLEAQIKRLNELGTGSKKAQEALAKLRLELAGLGQLDGLLGDTPTQMELLERRVATLNSGLKNLVDAGVSTTSKAFRGFVSDTVELQQALDKLRAAPAIDLKPVNVKSLIPQTIGDSLPQDVARLLGDYAKQVKPFELPVPVKLNMQAILSAPDFGQILNKELLNIGNGFQLADRSLDIFGNGFDAAAAKVNVMGNALQSLLAQGLSPLNPMVAELGQQFRTMSDLANINTAATGALASGLAGLANGLLEGLGQLAVGNLSLAAFGETVLGLVGKLATQLGEAIVAVGIGMLGLKTAFTNPFGAIAAGAALIVVGAALSSIASSAANSGGGSANVSTAVPSTPKTYTPATQTQAPAPVTITHVVKMVQRGADLVGAINIQTTRSGRIGGSGG